MKKHYGVYDVGRDVEDTATIAEDVVLSEEEVEDLRSKGLEVVELVQLVTEEQLGGMLLRAVEKINASDPSRKESV